VNSNQNLFYQVVTNNMRMKEAKEAFMVGGKKQKGSKARKGKKQKESKARKGNTKGPLDLEKISTKALASKFVKHEPNKKQLMQMLSIILEYIKKKKRKVYGGAAIHYLLKKKGVEGIYKDEPEIADDVFDIDFCTPEPKVDLHEMCNAIFKAGLVYVSGTEAGHDETFSVQYHNIRMCDLSFVPPNIYNSIPTVTYQGLHLCAPEYIMIDMYRQRSNPTNSFYKLDKFWPRQEALLKYYPEFSLKECTKNEKEAGVLMLPQVAVDSVVQSSNVFPIGAYATNIYISISKQKVAPFSESVLEVVSLDVKDTMTLADENTQGMEKKWVEFSPFGMFYGGSAQLFFKVKDSWKVALKIYDYRDRCVPFFQYGNTQMPSFDYLVCFWYFEWIRQVSLKRSGKVAKCAIGTMHHLRKTYKPPENASNHPFQRLRVDCKGDDIDTLVETSMRRQKRAEERKRIVYRYHPKAGIEKAPPFYFTNSTGREVVSAHFRKFVVVETDGTASKDNEQVVDTDVVETEEAL
jgi:hypothetical protein